MLSHFSHIQLFAAPWTVAHQTPLSIKFSRQEYWSGLPFSPPGNLTCVSSLLSPASATPGKPSCGIPTYILRWKSLRVRLGNNFQKQCLSCRCGFMQSEWSQGRRWRHGHVLLSWGAAETLPKSGTQHRPSASSSSLSFPFCPVCGCLIPVMWK